MEIYNKYIKIVSAENIAEVKNMKMMKTPGKFMLGVGLTAAAAVAVAPVVRSMMNNRNSTSSGNSSDNYSLH